MGWRIPSLLKSHFLSYKQSHLATWLPHSSDNGYKATSFIKYAKNTSKIETLRVIDYIHCKYIDGSLSVPIRALTIMLIVISNN